MLVLCHLNTATIEMLSSKYCICPYLAKTNKLTIKQTNKQCETSDFRMIACALACTEQPLSRIA